VGWTQSRPGHYGEEKNLGPAGIRTPAAQPTTFRNIITSRHIFSLLSKNASSSNNQTNDVAWTTGSVCMPAVAVCYFPRTRTIKQTQQAYGYQVIVLFGAWNIFLCTRCERCGSLSVSNERAAWEVYISGRLTLPRPEHFVRVRRKNLSAPRFSPSHQHWRATLVGSQTVTSYNFLSLSHHAKSTFYRE
jgi:hypothetical protein